MPRHDYAYTFRINAASGQAAQTAYADHVEQMIRQVLLTDPGERIDMPDFGCGLRKLIFAPLSDALAATTQLLVRQSLARWLSGQVQVKDVTVSKAGDLPDGQLQIIVSYVLIETQTAQRLVVPVN